MSKLKLSNFYYGAVLNAILEKNPEFSPTLVLYDDDNRQAYKILTEYNENYILFLKYATSRNCKKNGYNSWTFNFSQNDKKQLQEYSIDSSVFICLLCLKEDLQNSQLAILTYNEYLKINNKNSITINLEKRKKNFGLFLGHSKARKDTYPIPRNRIEKSFKDILNENNTKKE